MLKRHFLILQNALIHSTLRHAQDVGCWTTFLTMSLSIPMTAPMGALTNSSSTLLTDFVMKPPLINQHLQSLLMQVSFLPGTCKLFQLPISGDLENRCCYLRCQQDEPQLQIQSCLLFDLVLLRPLPLISSALLSLLTLLLQLGEQLMLLFTQARPTPLPLSKSLGVSSLITLIALFTLGLPMLRLQTLQLNMHFNLKPISNT